jgi:hypothetical protein
VKNIAMLLPFVAAACGSSSSGTPPAADLAMAPVPDLAVACQHKVTCTDESVQELGLKRPVNTATITNTADGDGWLSEVDATAGGFTPTRAYVYATFGGQGLTRVDVGDEDAFASTKWDLAFRRFVIRLNSGPSGPSCVVGAAMPNGTKFESVDPGEAAGLEFGPETYMKGNCTFVMDPFGIGSPATVTQTFWKYQSCVQMTGQVFIIKLADGRLVKAQVVAYYEPAAQKTCDTTGTVPMGTPGGRVRLRWAFVK